MNDEPQNLRLEVEGMNSYCHLLQKLLLPRRTSAAQQC